MNPHARIEDIDLVGIRDDDEESVPYARCLHREVLLVDEYVEGHDLIGGVHGWNYRYDTGVRGYDNPEGLKKLTTQSNA